jgi:hypothetical protein
MERRPRDEFTLPVKRILAQRVGLLCSNPGCRALTSGPQSDPSGAINIGVAAHITGAAPGGPRFDVRRSNKERGSIENGIWLCQNCAKLIDSDLQGYPAGRLWAWKVEAEKKAAKKIGQTDRQARVGSHQKTVAALKREQKLRDDLHRDLLKSQSERMSLPRFTSRSAKFAHSEVIVHRIEDKSYPNLDDAPGISGWFKLEVLDFYHGGLACIYDLKYALLDSDTPHWSFLSEEQRDSLFPPRFSKAKIFVTGNIPWRNILHYDMRGDEYYPQPHLYCQFADMGAPYEGESYFLIGTGYEKELRAEDRMQLADFLMLPPLSLDRHH